MTCARSTAIAAVITATVAGGLAIEVITTGPVRGSIRSLSELFTIANRPDLTADQRLAAARSLCTARYREAHPLALAAEGGIVGIPRNINKNFQAWREGPNVWVCPTNRIGPVYQFVYEEVPGDLMDRSASSALGANLSGARNCRTRVRNDLIRKGSRPMTDHGNLSKYALLSDAATAICLSSGLQANP